MFLHPHLQRSLYKTIRAIGKTNQVIYITHSPHFVTIPEFDEIRIVKKGSTGTEVIKSDLVCTDKLREKFRKELDPERNEFFFANKVLFVEGDTEKMSLPAYSHRLKIDLDRTGATIVEVGGKRNLMDFVDLAISFHMQVGFVYDVDSSDFNKNQKVDEAAYNRKLDDYASKGVSVFRFEKNFEDELFKEYGDQRYQEYCSTYGGFSKAVRARLFAIDENIPVPKIVWPIVEWLAGKTLNQ